MFHLSKMITNELGNTIRITVMGDDKYVTTIIVGPTSTCEDTLTRLEAEELFDQLKIVLNR